MLMDTGADVNVKLLYLAPLWANLGLVYPAERSAKHIAALGVLTEEEVVVGPPSPGCATLAHIQEVP